MSSVIFLRAANVGGTSVFSTAKFAKELDLVNIGAAGTFVAKRSVTKKEIEDALPVKSDIAIVPGATVAKLVADGHPTVPADAKVFVSVFTARPAKDATLPISAPPDGKWFVSLLERRGVFVISARRVDMQQGVDVSALLKRAYGAPATTRGWPTMERVAKAISGSGAAQVTKARRREATKRD